jgi:hypothetical protein
VLTEVDSVLPADPAAPSSARCLIVAAPGPISPGAAANGQSADAYPGQGFRTWPGPARIDPDAADSLTGQPRTGSLAVRSFAMRVVVLAVPGCPNAMLLNERLAQVLEVIGEPAAAAGGAGSPAWLDALGRSGRGRVAPAERGLRAVHQAVLRSFADTGRAPALGVLAEAAGHFDAGRVLAELAEGDFLYLDQAGQISAAYPFSAAPTRHKVQIAGGASAYAMCAIDALGMARMLRADVAIWSSDRATGEPVTVTVSGNHARWHPGAAVVFVGRTASACAGPSAAVCCEYINFFASRSAATTWATAHPEVTGGIVSQDRALEVGEQIFGQILQ